MGKSSSSRGTQGAKLSLETKNRITNYFGVDNWAGLREGVGGQGVTAVASGEKLRDGSTVTLENPDQIVNLETDS